MTSTSPLLGLISPALLGKELNPDRGVALVSAIALLLFGGIWLLLAVPVARGLLVGLRTGDWWEPFERNHRGGYGLLASSRFFASFRAPEPSRRTRSGLVTRWAVWGVVILGLAWYPAWLVGQLVGALLA